MNNTRRSVFLAMSVALVLPGCAPESGADDSEGLDTRTVESSEQQLTRSESRDGLQPSDNAVAAGSGADAAVAGCAVFPAGNWWNTDISSAAVDPKSATYVATIGASTALHPDFGTQYGIPSVNVNSQTAKSKVTFDYANEATRALPDPRQSADRERLGRAHPHGPHRRVQALRALRRVEERLAMARRLRGDLGSDQELHPPQGLDERRRRRPAHLSWPGPLRGGGLGRDQPRSPLHRAADAARLCRPGQPLRLEQLRRVTPRWACASASRPASTSAATPRR